jgi:GntR family transcriptional regulator
MSPGGPAVTSRPRYLKIRDKLIDRISRGEWLPGQRIPTEPMIAAQYDVGAGTARQAVGELEKEKLVVRIQGYGTLVYEHTPQNILPRFFGFYDRRHRLITPKSTQPERERGRATPTERTELNLGKKANVIRLNRLRLWKGKPFVMEMITLPEALFPNLWEVGEFPNTLYDFYQKTYRVTVAHAEERLGTAAADRAASKALGVARGAPLLRIERIAYGVDGTPVEWCVRLCHLDNAYYLAGRK